MLMKALLFDVSPSFLYGAFKMPRVFLITGAGRGLGHAIAQVLLDAGEFVVATTRNPTTMSFRGTTADNFLSLKLDVTSTADIDSAISAALDKFSRIDVVVNNAAYGLIGPLETLTDAQIRDQFDTNFFSVASMTRRAISAMRSQSPPGGLIMQVSSVATLMGFPMLSAMCASKWAVEGFTEATRSEMKPEWGIKLVSVKMDELATEAHQKSMVYGNVDVPEYDHLNARAWVQTLGKNNINVTDPVIAARAIYSLSTMDDPPGNAIVGNTVRMVAKQKLKSDEELLARDDLLTLVQVDSSKA